MHKFESAVVKRYCNRILESHKILEGHIAGLESKGEWKVGNVYFDAVSMQLEVITEYVCKILDQTGEYGQQLPLEYPEVSWSQIHRFRQLLAHWYLDKVSPPIIKELIADSLPKLIRSVESMKTDL